MNISFQRGGEKKASLDINSTNHSCLSRGPRRKQPCIACQQNFGQNANPSNMSRRGFTQLWFCGGWLCSVRFFLSHYLPVGPERRRLAYNRQSAFMNPFRFSDAPHLIFFLITHLSSSCSHLLVGDGDEALLGEFPQGVDICPHVQLTANQHHFGIGTELLRLPLPLSERHRNTSVILPNMRGELPRHSDNLWLLWHRVPQLLGE